ncbi:sodium:proton antiporter [Azospirillum sp. TSH7]|uniref:cation:proton antiporter n=1 Tax=unclassified Azospirillum TaxID=2630922 RepID=UPI000D619361|nr:MULTISPECIES: sodium:proton antiporter [unclassified Azospirillum]PWC55697.1 sodium:proton antiporter [Azospirillum sp. TSH7]PWC68524.1 sodium:proton antiporter [Azospirillum sp. TSH20]QCG93831.1 sodium:proton antiporter [Azospirillum sp. TSA2s]
MGPFHLAAILLTLAAAFGFINYKWLKLPSTIALFFEGLALALLVSGADSLSASLGVGNWLRNLIQQVSLPEILLDGILSLLLYAAAVNEDLCALLKRKWTVLALATLGVMLFTGLMGLGLSFIFRLAGIDVPLIWCMVLGAAIAPTDPVAVHGILGRLPVPETLRSVISGESLFNDGVGVVVFATLLHLATGSDKDLEAAEVALDFVKEAFGGAALGFVCGWIAYQAKRRIDESTVELTISLALVLGTYSLASRLGVSGPIAVVVAGLLIGYTTEKHVSSDESRRDLQVVWAMIDSVLNALLFLLVGLEATVVITWTGPALLAAALAVPLALVVRLLSLTPALLMHVGRSGKTSALIILTWAGLRGGIAVALVLSLPASPYRDSILAVCYVVVAFTILVQGLTLEPIGRRLYSDDQS